MYIANLPWYDFAELESATDAWWEGLALHLARAGIDEVPLQLDREQDHIEQWQAPNLLWSQACGYDVLYDAAADLAVVATPRYDAPGCEGASYRSAVLVRDDRSIERLEELRGSVCAINEAASHSGTNALRPLIAPLARDGRFFGAVRVSGDHVTSLEMVATRAADVACVDVIVLELCRRVRPHLLSGLRVLTHTELALAPPYVTSARTSPALIAQLRAALRGALADASLAEAREQLLIGGAELLDANAYRELARFEAAALAHGYFELPAPRRSPLSSPPHSPHSPTSSPVSPTSGELARADRRSSCGGANGSSRRSAGRVT